jgi:serine/threonine protein kinase
VKEYLLNQALMPGTVLHEGRYSIDHLISQGGFSFVYCAFDKISKNSVAIKEFFSDQYLFRDNNTTVVKPIGGKAVARTQSYMSYFIEEREITSRINHPGVITIIDSFFENQTAYLVMKLIEGQSLSQQVEQSPYTYISQYEKVFELISKLINILSNIHSENICHLDISPDNILLDAYGEIFLIDFGSALVQFKTRKFQPRKRKYAPIEVIKNKNIGIESDIFQLGMTIHELLLGYLPPSASKRISKINKTGKDPLKLDNLREPWQALVAKAISLDKRDRPNSVDDLWKILSCLAVG